MRLCELVGYLDDYLRIREIKDTCVNGLEVQGGGRNDSRRAGGEDGEIRKVALAVDCNLETFKAARREGAQMLIVHHGLFWEKLPPVRLVGPMYERVKFLLDNGIALYAAHLPIDMHPHVGNNIELARLIGLSEEVAFGEYHGVFIGVAGKVTPTPLADIAARLNERLNTQCRVLEFGPAIVRTVAVCSGRAPEMMAEAYSKGIDLYVTGETSHEWSGYAEDAGMNVIFAGHWATETLGVKALGRHISQKFGLETVFIPHPTGL
ncbi:MAG TPA: Nif3-like dinuclear metal center hexameric protein [Firmicutes bacterium]|nr:Nif3-like dinuclear metal center hexameric protein [Bacillota bacterium]